MNSKNNEILQKGIRDGYLTLPPNCDSELILRHLKHCVDQNLPRVCLFPAGEDAFVSADIRPLKFSKLLIKVLSDFDLKEAIYGDKLFFRISADQGEALARRLVDHGIYEIQAYNWRGN